ncbi:uncharacterized protein RHOBADRAFT_52479 [Rhodotorula graminis WP1]|uniref:Uncharacterized protein n=1 Tax=Rhodotorula graminis (strain WP1) TaxID=578459 RepID=A0A194SAQ5_RHOGW|nr:uncharacterized protein RHOBADRAFT_52479 [Rhodotorula graminis WP1]KPV76476.1 hypothetical protein RHOBADRAFT_52479 [Rhodotorula graminis WP1]
MHATLPTHVLALAPDSLASLGELDSDSLSELWGVFTRCKDSLQNGRRLENLSWRLWFDSGRRDDHVRLARDADHHDAPSHAQIHHDAADNGWSDPEGEWEETSGSDDSSADEDDVGDERHLSGPEQLADRSSPTEVRAGRSKVARKARSAVAASVSPPAPPRGRTVSVPASPAPPTALGEAPRARAEDGGRPPLSRRGFSRDCTISGGSLQRMIADLQRLPEIPHLGKARSLHDVSSIKPALGSRMSSAPDNLNAASLTASAPSSPTGRSSSASTKSSTNSTRRSTPAGSPCMSRSVSSPAHTLPTLAAAAAPAPASAVPPASSAALSSRRVPSGLAMSTLPATAAAAAASGPTRRSRPPTPLSPASPPSPVDEPEPVVTMTPSETAMLALSHSRSRSDVTLNRRAQSTAELASSFKPQSFVKGFAPSSIETRPGPGRIAPPPTPATFAASLGASPPRAGPSTAAAAAGATRSPSSAGRTSGSTTAGGAAATPLKVPVPSANAPTPGPSALRQPKAPGTGKKIFFISSPDSDEDQSSSRSRESRTTGGGASVVVSPPSCLKAAKASLSPSSGLALKAGAALNGKGKGKQPALAPAEQEEDDSDWDSDDDDEEDGSSGWGSEYSTDSDIARNSAAKAPGGGRNGGAQRDGFDTATLFAKRPADALQRTASTATMGAPGELTRRPPGLLSQLFHPEDYMEEVNRLPTPTEGGMRRPHKSMSALPTMSQLRPSKSTSGLEARPAPPRTKSFLKGKPEHVELESSSEEEDGDEAAPRPAAGSASHSSEYEDVDDDAEAKAAAAAALARRQRELEEATIAAPPQTPRTTRRAMLATELSESLRRNLLWERQMRNRVMGGAAPRRPTMPGQPLPQRPASSTQLAAPPPPPPPGPLRAVTDDGGVRAPNPSPATRFSPPHAAPSGADPQRQQQQQQQHHRSRPNGERHPGTATLPRRHTTGTGLYLQAQLQAGGRFPHAGRARGDSDSELSASSDDDDDDDGTASPAEPYATSIAGQRVW